ncbi:unnamed protein product [Trichobilharzia szidati]|nr:unnamed protein product [Trichobilharzia szidati]
MLTHTTTTTTHEFEQYYNTPTTDTTNTNTSSSSYPIFTKTPNVSPADSLILNQPLRRSYTVEMRNQSRQNKTFCLPFSRTNKSPYKLLPDRWSFKSNDRQISLAVNGYKAGSNLQETETNFPTPTHYHDPTK